MADAVEVVVRLGESILEVQYTDGRYALAGELLVENGRIGGVPLEPGARILMRRGLVDIAVTRVDRPERSVPLTSHGDRRALSYIAASLAVHLVVWAVAPALPDEPETRRQDRHLVRLASRAWPLASRGWDLADSPAFQRDGAGSPMTGAAGAAGGNSPSLEGRIQIAKRQDEPQIARASAVARAGQAGIVGALDHAHGFDAIVGSADLSSGFDRTDVHAPLYGGEGAGRGTFGLARGGTGDSAGCPGGACGGIIGVGSYGTLSNGTGTGYGWGGGRGGMQGRETAVPTVRICGGPRPCVISGALDKAIVRRYIRRALPKITYCYEKELLASAALAGEVTTDFLIAQDGTVHDSTASGVSLAVASCVAGVLGAIEFPRSREGATRVSYPFTFRPAGS